MVGDDIVDFFQRNDRRHPLQHFGSELFFYRIDKGDLVINYQKRVISRAALGFITVKIADVPIFLRILLQKYLCWLVGIQSCSTGSIFKIELEDTIRIFR